MRIDSSLSQDEEENERENKNICYLLCWDGIGEVMTEAIINSRDPSAWTSFGTILLQSSHHQNFDE